MRFVSHVLGLDSPNSSFYLFWSGVFNAAAVVAAKLAHSARKEVRALRQAMENRQEMTGE